MLYKMLGIITMGVIIIIFHILSAKFLDSYLLLVLLIAVQMQIVIEQENDENRTYDPFRL